MSQPPIPPTPSANAPHSATASRSANAPYGFQGRYLRVDVSHGQATWEDLPAQVLRQFLGGTGLGVYLLLREKQAVANPLAENGGLAFTFSSLVGSPLTTSAKFAVVCKSPLTDRYNDSLVSSTFAIAGKRTGADAIYITGRAAELSVLVVDDGRVRVEPCPDLRGLSTSATQEALVRRLGSDFQTAVIGPAGEAQVRFATISHDGRHAGRGGTGAVLGARNLKAIAVRGSQRVPWADPEGLYEYAKWLSQQSLGPATSKYRELGTVANLLAFNRLKTLPTRNFRRGSFSGAEQISPEAMQQDAGKRRTSCAACTIGCEHQYALAGDPADPKTYVRLEYENLFALGSLCSIDDPQTVLRACQFCDEAGIDTISAGGTIAFAMECVERGWLDAPWLRFGDSDAMLRALSLIAARDGLGDLLADGSRRLSHHIGANSASIAAHVKGLELPGYEPRGAQTMALGFAVGARGADHNRSGAYEADFSNQVDRRHATRASVTHAIDAEDRAALIDSLVFCKFLRGVFVDLFAAAAQMLQLVTGWDISGSETREISERIVATKKYFNMLAGWTPAEDTLPARFFDTPLEDDPDARISRSEFASLIRHYNRQRGWTEEGYLTTELIASLGFSLRDDTGDCG